MELIYLATFLVALVSSILSGIAGGGGGFIMAPYWLMAGLSPVQGATAGAFTALGMGGSSLVAFRSTGHIPRSRKLTILLLCLTLLTSIVGPFFLPHVSLGIFKPTLAVLTIVSLPLIFIDRKSVVLSKRNRSMGIGLLGVLLLASSFIASSSFSIMIAIVLSQMFELTVLQSTALRRLIGIVQSAVIFIVLVALGGFVWQHCLAAITGGAIGSYLGTKFAIKKGERFAKYALAVGAITGSIALFF